MPDFRIGYRPFPEQQAYFRRKVNMPSERWDDLKHGEHAHGFMVAGVARADVLDEIRSAVQAAIDDGEGFGAFQARFEDIVRRHGWPGGAGIESDARRAWRMRTIYQTNLRTSYMAGRWQELQAFPFLRYQHNTVANPREQHLAWNGLVLASDDPWWSTHYPPNGWGCRCTVTGVGKGRMRVLGKDGPDPTPEPGEGDPPPEWAYHPGKAARSLPAAEAFGRKVMGLPPEWRAAALDDAALRQAEWFTPSWRGYVDTVEKLVRSGRPSLDGAASPVGFLSESAVAALQGRGITPPSALLAMTDRQVAHVLRDAKKEPQALLEALRSLPDWISRDDTLIFKDDESIQFGRWLGGDRHLVAVVRLDSLQTRARDRRVSTNWITTLKVIGRSELGKLERWK